ncbi:neuregulin 3 [Homo sapiens]|uniref:Neuregulin 3 n=2 Tax=Homininae TaxID=207598 RepID=D9ZHQ3_HUMAN|nr:neuregulin 3 variant 9 [Homo sapiens]ADK90028.1 neuregulin 3 variant 10 [Homo sapiens]KAI2556477.1 neuregulin 3 [Homo sapiens]KAI4076662.1 neuregulin 3 [Homo sapiens]
MECGIPPTLVCVGRGGGLHTVGVFHVLSQLISLCTIPEVFKEKPKIRRHIPQSDPSTSNPAETRTLHTVSMMASAL